MSFSALSRDIPMQVWLFGLALACAASLAAYIAYAQHQSHVSQAAQSVSATGDKRQAVPFPPELREHTLANMRDHLFALHEIQQALGEASFDKAADIAEARLGMTSLKLHGAHEVSKYMPQGMQDIGSAMHSSASRFSIAAQEAAVTGDVREPLRALSRITANCVACHAEYKLQ
jgi:hypothetical protein